MPNKGVGKRKAVSPVIATLLLIAIAVAVAIIAYSWVTGLAGGLMGGGGQQVASQLSLDAYDYKTGYSTNLCNMTVRNVGGSVVNITAVYFDGTPLTFNGAASWVAAGAWGEVKDPSNNDPTKALYGTRQAIDPGSTIIISIRPSATPPARGSSHTVTIVTSDGAKFSYTVIAGRTG